MSGELAARVWQERVDRGLADGRHARECVDATHAFLRAVDGQPAEWIGRHGPPTEIEQRAIREFMDELGRVTGVGPMPS
jgi:hypothetical protein